MVEADHEACNCVPGGGYFSQEHTQRLSILTQAESYLSVGGLEIFPEEVTFKLPEK